MKKAKILIADDDYIFCELTKYILTENNFEVILANDSATAINFIEKDSCDLILLDLYFPDYKTGINTLKTIKNKNINIPIIVITSDNMTLISRFQDLIHTGAYDIIEKPVQEERLLLTIRNAVDHFSFKKNKNIYREAKLIHLIGNSPAISKVRNKIEKNFDSENNLVIYCESGTGAKNIVKKIHQKSSRKDNKIYSIECSKLTNKDMEIELFGDPKESNYQKKYENLKVVKAQSSILLINDLHLMPLKTQEKFARTLLGRKLKNLGGRSLENLDVRLIFITSKETYNKSYNPNLCSTLIDLCQDELLLPSLNERVEDIPLLVNHLISEFNQATDSNISIQEAALTNLMKHKWKNNIAELEKVILKILHELDCDLISNKDIIFKEEGFEYFIPITFKEATRNFEKLYLKQIMEYHDGNLNKSAETLKIDRSNLFKKLQKHGINIKKKA